MKFKTLKDFIPKIWSEANDREAKAKIFLGNKLKQEAIKWIKERISNCVFSCRNNHQRCKEHKFWMERFNIREEEIKND